MANYTLPDTLPGVSDSPFRSGKLPRLLLGLLCWGGSSTALWAQQPAANIDQIRNGGVNGPVTPGQWVNGNAGASNAHYIEGHSIAYRVILTNLPANTTISLVLGYDITHSSRHALDYLTHYDRLQPHNFQSHHTQEVIDPRIGTPFAGQSATSTTAILAPSSTGSPASGQPGLSFDHLQAAEKVMTLWGASFVNSNAFAYVSQGNLASAKEETRIRVTFVTDGDGGTAVLAWGGHIASQVDWGYDGNGVPRSAAGISGSPYHMRLISWGANATGAQDGSLPNLGNQDRSLSAAAVMAPPTCDITPGAFITCPGGSGVFSGPSVTGLTYLWTIVSSSPAGAAVISGSNTGQTVTVSHITCGTYTLRLRVTQGDGQYTECDVSRSIVDDHAPVITPTGSIDNNGDLGCNPSAEAIDAALGTATATDNCDASVTVSAQDGSVVSSGCNRSQTRTFSATDVCGNTATETRTITWTYDETPPSISCGSDRTIACGSEPNFDTPSASDNCGGTPGITVVGTVTATTTEGTAYTRTWTATDACGNTASCSQTITVANCPHIFPTGTTCCQYVNGQVNQLHYMCYTATGTTVSNVIPGVFFYYTDVNAPSTLGSGNSFYIEVRQAKTLGSFRYLSAQNSSNVRVTTATCGTMNYTVSFPSADVVRIYVTGASAGAHYVVSVKYEPKAMIGSTFASGPAPDVTYSYQAYAAATIAGLGSGAVGGSTGSIVARSGCTDNTVPQSGSCTLSGATTRVSAAPKTGSSDGLSVLTTPNPYTSRIRFTLSSEVSGPASLEIYNTLGQKIGTSFQANMEAGVARTVSIMVPESQRGNIVYIFRVGDRSYTGKVLH